MSDIAGARATRQVLSVRYHLPKSRSVSIAVVSARHKYKEYFLQNVNKIHNFTMRKGQERSLRA